MNKRGIELSINFLVTFILAVVMLGLGIYTITQMYGGGTDILSMTQDDLKGRLSSITCSSEQTICVSGNHQKAQKDSLAVFGVKIYNTGTAMADYTLSISDPSIAESKNINADANLDLLTDSESITINPRDSDQIAIGVYVDKTTPAGEYFYDVFITKSGTPQTTTIEQLTLRVD